MKILLISSTNNIKNGYGNLTHEFCTFLQKTGIDFTLLLPRDEKRYDYITYKVEYILPPYIFDFRTKKILEYIRFSYATDADIVHSITEFPFALLAHKIARKAGKPLIIGAAGTYAVKPLLQFPEGYFLKKAYEYASIIVSISKFTGDMIQKYSGGISTPIKIIHPGVNFARFDKVVDTRAITSKYPGKKILLTVGVLKPRKGHDVVIRALGELKNRSEGKRDDFHYLIVGPDNEGRDEYRSGLEKSIIEFGLQNNVTFVGSVSDAELPSYFHTADIYIHTPRLVHLNFEGFGIVYLEAGACKKPAIASDSGGTRDAVVEGKTGIIVPENDAHATAEAIEKLLDNPELARTMGEAAYAYAREHDWKNICAKFLDVYKDVLKK